MKSQRQGKAKKRKTSRQKNSKTAEVGSQEDAEPIAKLRKSVVLASGPKVVVAVDFGTAYSGFAFRDTRDMKDMKAEVFYDWPGQALAGAKPYCKTETSVRYSRGEKEGEYHVQDWGWTASINQKKAATMGSEARAESYLVKKFKLQMAPSKYSKQSILTSTDQPLPAELTAERVTSDYLHLLSTFIMEQLQSTFGTSVAKEDVQWCLTVPAMWDDFAKQQMVKCAEIAGMVKGPMCQDPFASPHQIAIALEPEAAFVYCQGKWKDPKFGKGSKVLVVDAGGGTVDLVVHEKMESSGLKVKEVTPSTGGLCGGAFVDKGLNSFLERTIGCFKEVEAKFPSITSRVQEFIEDVKCCFDGDTTSCTCFDLPAKLATAWELHDKANGTWRGKGHYDQLEVTGDDLKKVFDIVVDEILELIREQLKRVPGIYAIMLAGGFSNSPYLIRRIREEFSQAVKEIVKPMEPGSAVCRGALAFGAVEVEVMLSRKSKKTYGICVSRPFRKGDPPKFLLRQGGQDYCKNVFGVFVKKGEDVPVDHPVKHVFEVAMGSKVTELEVFAADKLEPQFVTESGVELVGMWSYRFPPEAQQMKHPPRFEVGIFFGRAKIEIHVAGKNFKSVGQRMSFDFERSLS